LKVVGVHDRVKRRLDEVLSLSVESFVVRVQVSPVEVVEQLGFRDVVFD
jgi:hypothetical protein